MNAGAFANWVPRIPTIQRDLGLDDAELGVALLGAAGGQIAMMPVAAWLVARMGSRHAATAAAVVSSLVIVLPAAASSLLALTGALFVVGATGAVLDVAMNSQGILVERRAARPTLPYFHAVFSLGGVVGAGMGTAAAALGIAPQPHLLVAGGLFAALAVVTRGGLLADVEPAARAPGRARPDRYLLSLGLLACFALLVEGSVTDWSAVFLRNELHASAGVSGTGYIAFSVAMFVGAVAAPRLVTRHSPASLLRVGGLLTTASMLLVVFGQTVPLAVLGFAGIGVALSCSFPLILSAAGAHPTIPLGASVATVSMMGYTGFVAGPPLIGFVSQATSLSFALGLAGLLGLVLFAAAKVVKRSPAAADDTG